MRKSISVYVCVLICFATLFTSCKSDEPTKEEAAKKEFLKQISKDSVKIATELNKYMIQPPDPDYTGDYVDKYPSGVIKFTGFFRFGLRHGQWMAFYENGLKWSECFYDKGKKDGATMVYYQNGKLNYTGWHKQDLRDSLWFFYDEAGKEIDRRAYRMGEETGLVN